MAGIGVLVLLMFFCSYVGTEAKRISLTPGWEARVDSISRFSNGYFYSLASNSTIISSANSSFVLGLFSSDFSTTTTMIVCLLPFNSSHAIDVWHVGVKIRHNFDTTVLRIPQDQSQLQLIDPDGNVVWSVGNRVSALELTESGNLILYNSSQSITWQSFDHPADTFLPGQILTKGMQLTASNSSSSGNYSAIVEPSGAVYYSTDTDPYLPYYVTNKKGSLDYSTALEPCGDTGIVITYTSSATSDKIFYNGSQCNQNTSFQVPVAYNSKFRFFRLEYDGDFRHYLWKDGALMINGEMIGQSSACLKPDICGSYGICSNSNGQPQCSCPSQNSSSSLAGVFNASNPKTGCKPTTAVSCDASSKKNQVFYNVSDVTYFSNSYVAPLNWTLQEDCVSSCLSNCSCLAAFYEDSANISARACFHTFNHVSSLRKVSTTSSQKTYSAFLKVQLSTTNNKGSSSSSTKIIIISVSVVTGCLVAAIVGLIIWFKCKKVEDDFLTTVPGVPLKFSLKHLEDATDGFQTKLGEGGFGPVFGGKLKDGRSVAVKRLQGAKQGQKEFESEVRTLGGIDHINLVRLYGFCLEGLNRLLVYEWMPNGSLDKWLFAEDPDKVLPWDTRMSIAMDTAQGLTYLHEGCSHPVLHLDIKPQNILLGEYFHAKLSDLGMAKLINQDMLIARPMVSTTLIKQDFTVSTTQIRGTPGYLAPEFIADSKATKKCDIYSFGIVLLEIVTGQRVIRSRDPISGYIPNWVFEKIRSGSIMDAVDPKLNGNYDPGKAEQVIRLAFCCIHKDADKRPTMPQIIQMLQEKMEVPEPTFIQSQSNMDLAGNAISWTQSSSDVTTNSSVSTDLSTDSYLKISGVESMYVPR